MSSIIARSFFISACISWNFKFSALLLELRLVLLLLFPLDGLLLLLLVAVVVVVVLVPILDDSTSSFMDSLRVLFCSWSSFNEVDISSINCCC